MFNWESNMRELRLAFAMLFLASAASATTWYASPSGTSDAACTADDPGTIQAAVDKAGKGTSWETGDEVVLLAGTYDYTDTAWSGKSCVSVPRNKNYLTIRSSSGNPGDTILLGRGSETYVSADLLTTNEPFYARAVYTSASQLRIRGLTITNFYHNASGVAAGASSANLLSVDNCVIAGNTGVGNSPAIYFPYVLTESSFVGNRVTGSGTLFHNATGFFVTNCLFASNHAQGSGGVGNSLCATFVGCVFTNNAAGSEGGCLTGNSNARNVYAERCLFVNNTASTGGAVKLLGGTLTNCVFVGNYATNNNGAVTQYAGTPSFYNCHFENNVAGGSYGVANGLNAYNCNFIGNHAGGSGGAVGLGSATLSECVFSNNWAQTGGAVSSLNNSKPVITNCFFVHNCATNTGGALAGHPHVVYNSLFLENSATNKGGALYYRGTYYNCRFVRNSAPLAGVCANVPAPAFYDCEFIENQATGATGSAGALQAGTMVRCLFLRNHAYSYAAFSAYDGVSIQNCVFQENTAEDYAIGATGDMRNCLIISNSTTSTTHGLFYVGTPVNCTLIGNTTGGKPLLPRGGVNCLFHENQPYDLANASVTYRNCLFGTRTGSSQTLTDCVQTNNPHFNFGQNPKLAWFAPRRRSPARDAGAEVSWSTNTVDLAGNGRLSGLIDIGCYENWPFTDGTRFLLH